MEYREAPLDDRDIARLPTTDALKVGACSLSKDGSLCVNLIFKLMAGGKIGSAEADAGLEETIVDS